MPDEKKVTLHISEISRLCGIDLSIDKVSKILNSLEISHEKNSEEELTATVPYFRTDLEQEADLVEEVMRMYGYDKIPEVLPQSAPPVSIQSRICLLYTSRCV